MTLEAACSRFAEVTDFTSGCESCCTLDAPAVEDFLDTASDILYWLSGGSVFGECQGTVRPVRNCSCGLYGWRGSSWWGSGIGVGQLCQFCMCASEVDWIPLRPPVLSVVSVKIDGATLAPSDYTVTKRGYLYRTAIADRPPRWPSTQKLWRPDSEVDTFSITYTFGRAGPYPAWITHACVEIACELASWGTGGRGKLPQGTTVATMQNVTVSLQTRAEAIKEAKTYLPAVASFLAIANRAGSQSWIYSPEPNSPWSFPLA